MINPEWKEREGNVGLLRGHSWGHDPYLVNVSPLPYTRICDRRAGRGWTFHIDMLRRKVRLRKYKNPHGCGCNFLPSYNDATRHRPGSSYHENPCGCLIVEVDADVTSVVCSFHICLWRQQCAPNQVPGCLELVKRSEKKADDVKGRQEAKETPIELRSVYASCKVSTRSEQYVHASTSPFLNCHLPSTIATSLLVQQPPLSSTGSTSRWQSCTCRGKRKSCSQSSCYHRTGPTGQRHRSWQWWWQQERHWWWSRQHSW